MRSRLRPIKIKPWSWVNFLNGTLPQTIKPSARRANTTSSVQTWPKVSAAPPLIPRHHISGTRIILDYSLRPTSPLTDPTLTSLKVRSDLVNLLSLNSIALDLSRNRQFWIKMTREKPFKTPPNKNLKIFKLKMSKFNNPKHLKRPLLMEVWNQK